MGAVVQPPPLTIIIIIIILSLISSQCQHGFSLEDAEGYDKNLMSFKQSLINTKEIQEWNPNNDPCEVAPGWPGVHCDTEESVINGLELSDMELQGNGSRMDIISLSKVTTLQTVKLDNNEFIGPIPAFNLMVNLKELNLSNNNFSGEIPDNFFENITWLSNLSLAGNSFSGRIPTSLLKLQNLTNLDLGDNQFSGPVPLLLQPSLRSLNLSNNQLQGLIPVNMSRFGPEPFQGNPNLCGPAISVKCKAPPPPPRIDPEAALPPPGRNETGETGVKTRMGSNPSKSPKWVLLTILLILLFAGWYGGDPNQGTRILVYKEAKRVDYTLYHNDEDNDDDDDDEDSDDDEEDEMQPSNSNFENMSYQSSEGRSLSSYGNRIGNLVFVNDSEGFFHLNDLMTAPAEVLGNHGLGSTYRSILRTNVSVVVKRLHDMNKLDENQFGEELLRFGMIRHPNVLPPLAFLYQSEEKILVSPFIHGGSLSFALHGNDDTPGMGLNWPLRLKIIKGIARGMGFLHTEFSDYQLPHGNLKSGNVLLTESFEPLLTDYGFYQLLGTTHSVIRTLAALKCPEVANKQIVTPKSDVYCLGVLLIEIMTGEFPYQYLQGREMKGGVTDIVRWTMEAISENRIGELIDPTIVTPESLEPMEDMFYIAAACIEEDHTRRIDMREAIRRIDEIELEAKS